MIVLAQGFACLFEFFRQFATKECPAERDDGP